MVVANRKTYRTAFGACEVETSRLAPLFGIGVEGHRPHSVFGFGSIPPGKLHTKHSVMGMMPAEWLVLASHRQDQHYGQGRQTPYHTPWLREWYVMWSECHNSIKGLLLSTFPGLLRYWHCHVRATTQEIPPDAWGLSSCGALWLSTRSGCR